MAQRSTFPAQPLAMWPYQRRAMLSQQSRAAVEELRTNGVVHLRNALPAAALEACQEATTERYGAVLRALLLRQVMRLRSGAEPSRSNVTLKDVTDDTFQLLKSWSKDTAPSKIASSDATLTGIQLPKRWLNAAAR